MTREWMEPQAVLAEDGRAVAAFCSAADAALFARAARKLYGRELAAMEPEDTPEVEAEEPMDIAALLAQEDAPETAAEAAWKELAFPVYYERRQLLFPVAAFAEEALQALASALFAQFAGDGAAYPTARGASCLAPLQMATQEFLAAYEDRAGQSGEDAPQPYDAAVAFLARAARERPLADERTELEEFLAQTSFRVHRRDFPRWKDIFHLAIKRLKAAEEYAERRVQPVAEEELDAFLAAYQTKREEQKHQAEAATCRLSEGSKEQHFSQTAENGSFAGEEERRLADGIDGFVGTEGTERTEGMDGRNAGTGADGSISRRALRRTHKVLVDADACPVVRLIEKLCERYDVPVALFCDDHHEMASSYSEVIRVPRGKHAADYAIVGLCRKGDIVVTEDTGLAQLILAKEAYPIAADGWRYTARLPWQAADPRAARRALHSRMHKRSEADDVAFERGFLALLHRKFFGEEEW